MPEQSPAPIRLFAIPTSPYAMKVACYLAYKQLDYEAIGVNPITFQEVKFVGKRQIPVLQIGDEWKLESLDIGLWLEERFPQHPLLGQTTAETESILAIDNWISNQLITNMFRLVVDWPSFKQGWQNGWRLAHCVNQTTPIPSWARITWPLLLRQAGFIQAMVKQLDRRVPVLQAHDELLDEFVQHLANGPFLLGRENPSLADFSAYAAIVFPYRFGLQGGAKWMDNQQVLAWLYALGQHLPENPFLVDKQLLIKELPLPISVQ